MYLKELLGKLRFKAKYDYSAEKLKNVLIKKRKQVFQQIGTSGYSLGACEITRS